MTARELGKLGENAAAYHLSAKGYETVERNRHSRYGEVDIIARGHGYIVFAEVKLRTAGAMVGGLEAVDRRKMTKLIKTACLWLAENPCELQPRFDVLAVTPCGSGFTVEHIENAFGAEACDEIF